MALEDIKKKVPENLASQPPLTTAIVDNGGVLSRAWAIWFRDIYNRTSYKGGNAIDSSIESLDELITQVNLNIQNIQTNAENIATNAENIAINAKAIEQNAQDIAKNAEDILTNANAISTVASNLNTHVIATEAHGSNGDIVGFNDTATELLYGLVKRMANISDAVTTSVNIATADIGSAPATYDQGYTQSVTDLTNENKAAINQLASDFNDAVTVLNNLLSESQTADQMSLPSP
jgi:hypothetical protein